LVDGCLRFKGNAGALSEGFGNYIDGRLKAEPRDFRETCGGHQTLTYVHGQVRCVWLD
jgi:hypothetical protein